MSQSGLALREEIGVYDVARNMGTSVEMIEKYYGKQSTPKAKATSTGKRRDFVFMLVFWVSDL